MISKRTLPISTRSDAFKPSISSRKGPDCGAADCVTGAGVSATGADFVSGFGEIGAAGCGVGAGDSAVSADSSAFAAASADAIKSGFCFRHSSKVIKGLRSGTGANAGRFAAASGP